MHVLMTADTVGGVWTYATTLIRALQPWRVRFTLAVLGPAPSAAQRAELDRLPNVEWRQKPGRLEWMPDGTADVDEAGEWLLAIANEVHADLVHLNGYAHAAWPFRCPVLIVAHSCVCSWWRAVKGEAPPAHIREYQRIVERGLMFADLVIAPTRAMLSALVHEHGTTGEAQVIANGLDIEAPPAVPKEPIVLSAARFDDEAKNLRVLERAAERLAWPLVIAGKTHERASSHAWYLGRLDRADVRSWMARAAIFAHPARYEPFGLSPLEAAAAGCALVLGDLASLREVWGAAAAYVDPNRPEELVALVNALASDEPRRQSMAAAARRRAERYSAGACAGAYHDAYRALAGRSMSRFAVQAL